MTTAPSRLIVSVPYPVRLFGDLQDLLGLPALVAGLDERTAVACTPREDRLFALRFHGLQDEVVFDVEEVAPLEEVSPTFGHAFRMLGRRGLLPREGFDLVVYERQPGQGVRGNHPAAAVAWVLAFLAGSERLRDLSGEETADLVLEILGDLPIAHGAAPEIYACIMGGVLRFDPGSRPKVTPLERSLPGLILVRCQSRRVTHPRYEGVSALGAIRRLEQLLEGTSFVMASFDEVVARLRDLAERDASLAYAHLVIREHCRAAWEMLAGELALDDDRLGELLDDTDSMLRDYLGFREPGLEMMMDVAERAGALGCKVLPGTQMFVVFAPAREDEVIEAIRKAGGDARRAPVSDGMRLEIR